MLLLRNNKRSSWLSWCSHCFPMFQRVAPVITYAQTTESTESTSDNSTGSYGTGTDSSTDAYSTDAFTQTTDDGVTPSGDSVSNYSPIHQEFNTTLCASHRTNTHAVLLYAHIHNLLYLLGFDSFINTIFRTRLFCNETIWNTIYFRTGRVKNTITKAQSF